MVRVIDDPKRKNIAKTEASKPDSSLVDLTKRVGVLESSLKQTEMKILI